MLRMRDQVPVLLKTVIVLVCFIAIVGSGCMFLTQYMTRMHVVTDVVASVNRQAWTPEAAKYRQQRDDISRQLNLMKQAYGQQSCEQLKLLQEAGKLGDTRISENGGWCAEASAPNSSSHYWDKGLSTALSHFFAGKVVASFGDGPGAYKKHIDSLQEVTSYTAYDGAPYCETVTGGVVKFLDLTAPQFGLQAYDWVISLEVGEHIPAKYENIFLDNLSRHAKEGIILSWAVPGQGGLSHVNNKALVDVVAQMNKRGFDINKEAGEPLRKVSSRDWLRNNIHVYYRKNKETFIPEDV